MSRILFITCSPPHPTTIGGNQRSNLLYQGLSMAGDVDMILLHDPSDLSQADLGTLAAKFGMIECWPLPRSSCSGSSGGLKDRLAHVVNRLAHVSRELKPDPGLMQKLEELMLKNRYDVVAGTPVKALSVCGAFGKSRVVLDNHDLLLSYYESRLALSDWGIAEKVFFRKRVRELKEFLPTFFRQCRVVFIADEDDRRFPGLEKAVLLPNVPIQDVVEGRSAASNDAPRSILCLGAFSHGPNSDGVDFFVDRVWPRILARVPGARFIIVGSGITPLQFAGWSSREGVEVKGFVQDVAEAYASCAFSVAPIFWGAGTNIKVLESFAYERACVLTPFALRGYRSHLREGESVLLASTADDFVEKCVTLLEQPAFRHRLAANGQAVVRKFFSRNSFTERVRDTVKAMMEAQDVGVL